MRADLKNQDSRNGGDAIQLRYVGDTLRFNLGMKRNEDRKPIDEKKAR